MTAPKSCLLAATLLLAACAGGERPQGAAAKPGRECFLASSVTGFTDATNRRVLVDTGVDERFELETFGTCLDLKWTETLGLRATGGSPWICLGETADVVVPTHIGPQRCSVKAIRKLTAEEAKALRAAKGR